MFDFFKFKITRKSKFDYLNSNLVIKDEIIRKKANEIERLNSEIEQRDKFLEHIKSINNSLSQANAEVKVINQKVLSINQELTKKYALLDLPQDKLKQVIMAARQILCNDANITAYAAIEKAVKKVATKKVSKNDIPSKTNKSSKSN